MDNNKLSTIIENNQSEEHLKYIKEKVNEIVNPILDEADPISESYVLDVCSKEKGSGEDGQ